jgi:predicted MFS family arabinose efflux permease
MPLAPDKPQLLCRPIEQPGDSGFDLIAGSVVEMFGLRWQAMIQGIAFTSHQIGSFLGAFGGGVLFDTFGSYDLAWHLVVMMGLTAGVVQIISALIRPPRYATT